MHAALDGLSRTDLSGIKVTTWATPTMHYAKIDFSGDPIWTSGTGSVTRQLRGEVVDNGVVIGEFSKICEAAATGWEGVLLKAGVPIPGR